MKNRKERSRKVSTPFYTEAKNVSAAASSRARSIELSALFPSRGKMHDQVIRRDEQDDRAAEHGDTNGGRDGVPEEIQIEIERVAKRGNRFRRRVFCYFLHRSAHEKAAGILKDNMEKLHEIARFLLERETITGDEFMEILGQ